MAKADETNSITTAAWPAGAIIPSGLAQQQRQREKAIKRIAKLRTKASAEIERLIDFLDASDPYAATELEETIDDGPCDDNELDGPENGEDEDSDPAEPSLGSLDAKDDQTAWAAGGRNDLERDAAESGIGDYDGLMEQVGTQDWQHGAQG